MTATDRVVTAREAVRRYVQPGAIVGLGGQNINRCPMALIHESVRQRPGRLTVVGCNLSLPLDILAAAGLVESTEQGSGNLERYGSLFTWRRLCEQGLLTVTDYSHLGMASRFLAGSLGIPYLPTRSLLGTDIADRLIAAGEAYPAASPWGGEPVVLLRSCTPDVSLIHVSRADPEGNVVIDGVTSHEVDMVKASKATIVTAEEIVPAGVLSASPEMVTISCAYVDAVVWQPFGAFPTSVHKRYDFCEEDIAEYQALARKGGEGIDNYLAEWIVGVESFDALMDKRDPDGELRRALQERMRDLVGSGSMA